jgi:hypothetical protein
MAFQEDRLQKGGQMFTILVHTQMARVLDPT